MKARLLLLSLLLQMGCAAIPARPPAPTADEVVTLSTSGTAANVIIERMRAGRGLYALSGQELARLAGQGVAPEVLDYMQQTYIDAQVARARALEDPFFSMRSFRYGPAFPYGPRPFPYAPGPFCW